jgi:hypothetical protein
MISNEIGLKNETLKSSHFKLNYAYSSIKRYDLKKKIFSFLIGTGVSLICGELVLRVLFEQGAHFNNIPLRDLKLQFFEKTSQFDPILSWKPKASFKKIESNLLPNPIGRKHFRNALTTIEDGMRITPNTWNVPLNSKIRILAIGDSFTFGGEVHNEETWPVHLQALTRFKVFNGSFNGFGLDQSLLSLEPLIQQTKPTAVILSLINENIYRTVKTVRMKSFTGQPVPKPYFVFQGGRLKLMNVPIEDVGHREVENVFKDLLGRSVLADFVMSQIAFNYWYGVQWAEDFPRKYFTQEDPVKVSCAILSEFQTLSKQHHFIPIVLGQYYWRDTRSKVPQDVFTQKVLECARMLPIATVDLWKGLEKLRQEDPDEYNTLFFPGHHMTNRGNLWVANQLAPVIEEKIKQ